MLGVLGYVGRRFKRDAYVWVGLNEIRFGLVSSVVNKECFG